jgi:7,8-dihydropterin-6-yl-methyl-4-(beta-D-ribofuranosyl)aminobenzene 5'-phosphate synthase
MRRDLARCAVAVVVLSLLLTVVPQASQKRREALPVLPGVIITVLVDNIAGSGAVLGEWGLAYYLEAGQRRVLLDTGGGRTIIDNARALGVDLARTDAIVISHGHGDHVGGIERVLDAAGKVAFFVHPVAFSTRYWRSGSQAEPYSMPLSREQIRTRVAKLVDTSEPTLVADAVMATGRIPRVTDFEDTGVAESAFLDAAMKSPDPVADDQALFFRTPEGVVILVGCAHAGVVNTIRYVSELLGEPQIYAVVGGTHLLAASPLRMHKTVAALKQYGVQKIMLSHCTGVTAFAELANAFPGRCSWPAAGSRIRFGR